MNGRLSVAVHANRLQSTKSKTDSHHACVVEQVQPLQVAESRTSVNPALFAECVFAVIISFVRYCHRCHPRHEWSHSPLHCLLFTLGALEVRQALMVEGAFFAVGVLMFTSPEHIAWGACATTVVFLLTLLEPFL